MALIPCPECGHQVSEWAPTCPNCGFPILADEKAAPTDESEPKTTPKMERVNPALYDDGLDSVRKSASTSGGRKGDSHTGRNLLLGVVALVVLGFAFQDCGSGGGDTDGPAAGGSATTTRARATETTQARRITTTESNLTVSQRNAIRTAESYLDFTAFSRSGLIEQLEYEQYSTADATFAVDSLDVDWFEQAAKSAENYLDFTSFSRGGLIDQLKYEGFTQQQAEYGATAAGL